MIEADPEKAIEYSLHKLAERLAEHILPLAEWVQEYSPKDQSYYNAAAIIENGVSRFGDRMVHRGSSWFKSEERKNAFVDFKDFFNLNMRIGIAENKREPTRYFDDMWRIE